LSVKVDKLIDKVIIQTSKAFSFLIFLKHLTINKVSILELTSLGSVFLKPDAKEWI